MSVAHAQQKNGKVLSIQTSRNDNNLISPHLSKSWLHVQLLENRIHVASCSSIFKTHKSTLCTWSYWWLKLKEKNPVHFSKYKLEGK